MKFIIFVGMYVDHEPIHQMISVFGKWIFLLFYWNPRNSGILTTDALFGNFCFFTYLRDPGIQKFCKGYCYQHLDIVKANYLLLNGTILSIYSTLEFPWIQRALPSQWKSPYNLAWRNLERLVCGWNIPCDPNSWQFVSKQYSNFLMVILQMTKRIALDDQECNDLSGFCHIVH